MSDAKQLKALFAYQREIKRLKRTISQLRRRLKPLRKYEAVEESTDHCRVTCSNFSEFDEEPGGVYMKGHFYDPE